MCGIAGFLAGPTVSGVDAAAHVLRRMADAIAHRGPDGDGYWHDLACGIGLAHRRLAIVDLSPTGAQPMTSASGRFVMVYNGEIYNHRAIRERLPVPWRGTSDTETLLAGFEAWGIAPTITAAVGMFAIAVWDRVERSLMLARDRLGEKPLYYGWQGSTAFGGKTLIFGSELAAVRAHPAFEGEISRDALCAFMRFGNVGGANSIYRGVAKLPAGSLLTLKAGQIDAVPERYWSGAGVIRSSKDQSFVGGAGAAADALESLLTEAVGDQMMADVPLGAFLSGGIDSSLITALMQRQSARPVRTFSIGFREQAFDEAGHAQGVAKHLGTEHTEMYVTARDALDLVPRLADIYSEPFADASQIPTHLLSRLTRQHVTVALSGDGGDELFCGYNRYAFTDSLWRRLSRIPAPMRRGAARALLSLSPDRWNRIASNLHRVWPAANRWSHLGEKLHKGARVLHAPDTNALYLALLSQWAVPSEIVIGGIEPPPLMASLLPELDDLSDVERMMALDMLGYMCDDVLVKVDRAAMAASLETRAPFLDHRVVEFAWQLPMAVKLHRGQTKHVLREVLHRHVPSALIERPKTGFTVPMGAWLRGPLRDWAESLLDEGRLRQEGYFHPAPIRKAWVEHLDGGRNREGQLWNVLMFQAWLERTRAADLSRSGPSHSRGLLATIV